MVSELQSGIPGILNRWRRSARLAGAGILALILLIPLGMVQSVVHERHARYQAVIGDIAGSWAGSQTLAGPVLIIPYAIKTPVSDGCSGSKGKETEEGQWEIRHHYAVMLPDSLKISGKLDPETRHRGIYKVQVYEGSVNVRAEFLGIRKRLRDLCPSESLLQTEWQKASISVGLSDPRGIIDVPDLQSNNTRQKIGPGTLITSLLPAGFHGPAGMNSGEDLSVDLTMRFRGSSSFSFLPLGASTSAEIRSSWPDASFCGEILPDRHESGPQGFSAHWAVSLLNRSYPQSFDTALKPNIREVSSGVRLFEAVTLYDKVTRSAKYGLLFVCLSFLSLGLIEYVTDSRLSLVQYLLIGMALALFFLLLIAFAEHVGFAVAYLLAASSVVVLNTLYCLAFLPRRSLALLVGGLLAAIYGILYVILQAEDYALLSGSLLLTVTLTITMYLTRGIHRDDGEGGKNNER